MPQRCAFRPPSRPPLARAPRAGGPHDRADGAALGSRGLQRTAPRALNEFALLYSLAARRCASVHARKRTGARACVCSYSRARVPWHVGARACACVRAR
eukprot:5210388-Alexandrium_andersonii.AAC.1